MDAFVLEGFLNLYSQEGGNAAPGWEADGQDVANAVIEHFGVKRLRFEDVWEEPWARRKIENSNPGDCPIGRVRITIERLDNARPNAADS